MLLPASSIADEVAEHWGASLSWSPQYCYEQPGDIREMQCAEQHGFVVGGLESLEDSTEASSCPNRNVDIPLDVTERMLPTMWNKAAMKRQWNQFGRCSGWEMMDYFTDADYLANRVVIPEEFNKPFARLSVSADDVRLLFHQSNGDIGADSIMPRCNGEWLRDIVFCVDKDLKYQRCGHQTRGNCPARVWVRGINTRLKLRRLN